MSEYDAEIAAARTRIEAHEKKIQGIIGDITVHFDAIESEDDITTDFRPTLKAYARSKQLDQELIKSKILYEDLIPTMIHVLMEHHNGCSPHESHLDRGETIEASANDRAWVDVCSRGYNWHLKTYTHDEFVKLATKKNENPSE